MKVPPFSKLWHLTDFHNFHKRCSIPGQLSIAFSFILPNGSESNPEFFFRLPKFCKTNDKEISLNFNSMYLAL
jgi:hypothetical protein